MKTPAPITILEYSNTVTKRNRLQKHTHIIINNRKTLNVTEDNASKNNIGKDKLKNISMLLLLKANQI